MTTSEIELDDILPTLKVPVTTTVTNGESIVNIVSETMKGFAVALGRSVPDLLIILGDRYEMLGVATAAFIMNIPVAHIAGGDVSNGAQDDVFRHCITKLSALHFTSSHEARRRVIQLGEDATRVHFVGALGLDELFKHNWGTRDSVFSEFNLNADRECILVALHPTTSCNLNWNLKLTREVLDSLVQLTEFNIIITGANSDLGGPEMNFLFQEAAQKDPNRIKFNMSLGRERYLSVLRHCSALVGNSSSGIVEAHPLGIPFLNIGTRQSGRERASTVIDLVDVKDLTASLNHVRTNRQYREKFREPSPYYAGMPPSETIMNVIKNINLKTLLPKAFCDLNKSSRSELNV